MTDILTQLRDAIRALTNAAYQRGQEDMRERAENLLMNASTPTEGISPEECEERDMMLARHIRNLPIKETAAGETQR